MYKTGRKQSNSSLNIKFMRTSGAMMLINMLCKFCPWIFKMYFDLCIVIFFKKRTGYRKHIPSVTTDLGCRLLQASHFSLSVSDGVSSWFRQYAVTFFFF